MVSLWTVADCIRPLGVGCAWIRKTVHDIAVDIHLPVRFCLPHLFLKYRTFRRSNKWIVSAYTDENLRFDDSRTAIGATLRALCLKRRWTLSEHQRWAMELLGMSRFERTDTVRLLPALCDVVRAGVSGDPLVTATRKLPYESRFVIAGTHRLFILVQAAVSSVEHDTLVRIARAIPVQIRNWWLDALSAFALRGGGQLAAWHDCLP